MRCVLSVFGRVSERAGRDGRVRVGACFGGAEARGRCGACGGCVAQREGAVENALSTGC